METIKPEPLLVQYLSARYLVTVEAQNNEIVYELFNRPTEK